jgi:pimeloyl-ACP methyl ester carboxylesterase
MNFMNVPDARIAYQIDGDGPMLFLVGAPVGIAGFEPLATRLARHFTIVRHDPRGIGLSTIRHEDIPSPSLLADDLAQLIEKLAGDNATVLGTSGGAVTGLDLVTRRPNLIRVLVAHEPPLFTLLDDAGDVLARADAAFALAESDPHAAAQGFADVSEALHSTRELLPRPTPIRLPPTPPAEQQRNRYFLGRMAPATVHYRPDLARIDPARVIVAAGAESVGQPAWRAAHALATGIGACVEEAPGNHLGLVLAADAFAAWLRELLMRRV